MPRAGFDPLGEKWQLCLNIVVALPPKPPRLDWWGELNGHSLSGVGRKNSVNVVP